MRYQEHGRDAERGRRHNGQSFRGAERVPFEAWEEDDEGIDERGYYDDRPRQFSGRAYASPDFPRRDWERGQRPFHSGARGFGRQGRTPGDDYPAGNEGAWGGSDDYRDQRQSAGEYGSRRDYEPRRRGYQLGGEFTGGTPRGGFGRHEEYPRRDYDERAARGAYDQGRYARGGQQESFRGRGPQGYTRSDDRIREEICDVLTDDDAIDATNIEVRVSKGEVTLAGTVSDRQSKRCAEDIAEAVGGVRNVQNELRVGPASDKGKARA